jgi:hypothetical protein
MLDEQEVAARLQHATDLVEVNSSRPKVFTSMVLTERPYRRDCREH